MESYFLNGGMIGVTLDFGSTEQYVVGTTTELADLVYVGGQSYNRTGTTSAITVNFSLTGGIGGSLQPGDVVVAVFGTASNTNRTGTIFPLQGSDSVGYTSIFTAYENDTTDTNIFVGYKIMGATPDTGFRLPAGTGSTADGGGVTIQVWRNVDTTTPLDVTRTTFTAVSTGIPNPPAITTVTDKAVIIACGASGHTGGTDTFSSSELDNFLTASGSDTYDSTVGMGSYLQATAGTFNPAAFSFSQGDSTAFSTAACTLALRPATVDVPLYGNYKNSGIWNLAAVFNNSKIDYFYTGSYVNLSNLSTYTFTDCDFSTPTSDRLIVVVVFALADSFTNATMTIGGISATLAYGPILNSTSGRTYCFYANVPTGSTGTIEVSGGGTAFRCVIGVYALYNASYLTSYTQTGSTDQVATINVNYPAKSLLISAVDMVGASSSVPLFWTNIDEDETYDNVESSGRTVSTASKFSWVPSASEDISASTTTTHTVNPYELGVAVFTTAE